MTAPLQDGAPLRPRYISAHGTTTAGKRKGEKQKPWHARVRLKAGLWRSSGVYGWDRRFDMSEVRHPAAGGVTEGAVKAVYICGDVDGLR